MKCIFGTKSRNLIFANQKFSEVLKIRTYEIKYFKSDSHLPKYIYIYLLQRKPFKNDEKCFLFYLKNFRSRDIWIKAQVLVILKLNEREDFSLRGFVCDIIRPYLSEVTNWSTRIRCENCSRLRMKKLERCQWRRSVSILLTVNIFQTFF